MVARVFLCSCEGILSVAMQLLVVSDSKDTVIGLLVCFG